MDSITHPFAVWRHDVSGQVLITFPDEGLATKSLLRHGGTLIPNPCNEKAQPRAGE